MKQWRKAYENIALGNASIKFARDVIALRTCDRKVTDTTDRLYNVKNGLQVKGRRPQWLWAY